MSTNRPPKKKGSGTPPKRQPARDNATIKKEQPAVKPAARPSNPVVAPRSAAATTATPKAPREKKPLVFNQSNYYLLIASALLMIIGTALMAGGSMKDPNVWDESVIYSAGRLTLAPIVMLAGLGMGIWAIFKK